MRRFDALQLLKEKLTSTQESMRLALEMNYTHLYEVQQARARAFQEAIAIVRKIDTPNDGCMDI